MKKNYLLGCFLVALLSIVVSCNQEDQIIPESKSTTLEPDFFKNDGSMDESEIEEEAPVEVNAKTYYHYNYTLLKPVDVPQEKMDAICGESTTMPLLVGSRKKKVGEVEVSNDDENLYLTFTAKQYKYMKKVYLYIGEKGKMPKYYNGYPNLRKFNFKAFPYYFGGTKNATYVVPLSSIDAECFEIVAYSKVYDSYSRCYYSSFAYNRSLTQTYSYSKYSSCYYFNDWVRSFEYCKQQCNDHSCLDVFGKKDYHVFTNCIDVNIEDTIYSGWSSWVRYNLIFDGTPNGLRHDLQILRNTDGCDFSNGIEIGRVELSAENNGGTGLEVKYLIYPIEFGGPIVDNPNPYKISEINLYVGPEEDPYNEDGTLKSNIGPDNFYKKTFDTPVKSSDPIIMPWNGDTGPETPVYIIPYAKVCADL